MRLSPLRCKLSVNPGHTMSRRVPLGRSSISLIVEFLGKPAPARRTMRGNEPGKKNYVATGVF